MSYTEYTSSKRYICMCIHIENISEFRNYEMNT